MRMKRFPLDTEQEFTWKKNLEKKKEVSPFLNNKIFANKVNLFSEVKHENDGNIFKKRKYEEINDKLSSITFSDGKKKNDEKELANKQNENINDRLNSNLNFIYILISYLHLLINCIITCLFIYIIFSLLFFIKRDINTKIIERKLHIKNLSEEGEYNYRINKCDPRTRVPALNLKCTEWEVMMNRKIDSVEVTRIVLEVLGESLDGFVKRFSLKSCLIGGMFFIIFLMFRNSRFGR